jgi:hypothetical protein
MQIQAICHACLLFQEGNTTILVDPWIKGAVFMGGWALNPPPLEEVIHKLPAIDYIYLTHEHSDHTHIGSLKGLFEGPAKDATLLIPQFMTDRFRTWLQRVLPTVTILEMAHGKEHQFGALRCWSYQYRNDDSTIVLQSPQGFTCINSNDTFVKGIPLKAILKAHPNPDVVISQFSIANAYPYAYTDYHTDPKSFPWDHDDLKQYCVDLLKLARPKFWIPYQSFTSFCRPENDFLNQFKISLDEIDAFVSPRVKGVTRVLRLYPGDVLEDGQYVPHPNGKDHFYGPNGKLPVEERNGQAREELLQAARTFEKEFKDTVAWVFRRKLRPCGFVSEDDNTHLLFDPKSCQLQVGQAELKQAHPDVSWTRTSQRVLTDSFKLPWGMASLLISGCMKTEVPAEHRSQDFLFWAVGLIRHTGYFNLKTLWFLKPRALTTAFRRRHEAYDILYKTLKAGSLTKGNIVPRHNTVE